MNNLYTRSELTKLVRSVFIEENIMNTTNLIVNELSKLSPYYEEEYSYAPVKHKDYNNICLGKIKGNTIVDYISYHHTIEYYFKGWINRTQELRDIISPQIKHYRNTHCELDNCKLCGKSMKDAQVDHEIPFKVLVDDWLITHNLDIESFSKLSDVQRQLLCKDFSDYHLKHAKLRYLCKHCNLTRPKK